LEPRWTSLDERVVGDRVARSNEELTGKARNRFYRASEIFDIINKPIDRL
jgi:hypothetical protein